MSEKQLLAIIAGLVMETNVLLMMQTAISQGQTDLVDECMQSAAAIRAAIRKTIPGGKVEDMLGALWAETEMGGVN